MDTTGLILAVIGFVSIAAAYFDWDWYMNDRRVRFVSKLVGGRYNGRFFYAGLGILIIFLGLSGALNNL